MRRTAKSGGTSGRRSALERGFAVLHCFEDAMRPLANGDISQHTGIPKPTVTRVIATLVRLGYLKPAREPDHYELSARTVRLARAFLDRIDLRAIARPYLGELAEFAGAASFLAVRDGPDVVLVETARARSAVVLLRSEVGTRLSLATSALGRAWLASLGDAALARVLGELAAFHGPAWPKLRKGLARALAETRRAGCCVSIGDWHADINTAAVPLRTAEGELMAINCGGPAFALSERRLRDAVVPRLVATAHAIAEEIGGAAAIDAIRHTQSHTEEKPCIAEKCC